MAMSRRRRILIAIITLIAILVICRGFLFRTFTTYQDVEGRSSVALTDETLIRAIEDWQSGRDRISVDDAVRFALKLTARKLSFSTRPGLNTDPNAWPDRGKSNCVGYSSHFNAIANYIFSTTPGLEHCSSMHRVGRISLLGLDLHRLTDDPFWADHDFNSITQTEHGHVGDVDPTVYDYLRIGYVQ